MVGEERISKEQAAALLGISVRQLARLAKRKQLTRYTNDSGHVRYSRRQVIQLRHNRERFVPQKLAG